MSHYDETYQDSRTAFDETGDGTAATLDLGASQVEGTSRHKRPGRPNRDNIGNMNAPRVKSGHDFVRQDDNGTALLRDPEDLRKRWESVQVGFVDNPRQAVGEAENLVSSAIDQIVSGFRRQSARLEAEWSKGHDASTDELRLAFQRYREFFGRLLEV
jgi:hypothetical protein